MSEKFTENQRQAINTDGSDICVAAGAGSGKTGVLVERFVRLVTAGKQGLLPPEQRARVDEILVITFTEKATKEMKTRIVEALMRLNLVEERRQVETAYISTIHGFCSRLLQENPFEAGVDPQFRVLDETQSRRLLRQSFEVAVSRAYAAHNTEITEMVAATQGERAYNDTGNDSLAVLMGAAENLIGKMRGAGKSLKTVEKHYQDGQEMTSARSLEPVWLLLTPLLTEINAALITLSGLRDNLMGTTRLACDALMEHAEALHPDANSLFVTLSALEAAYKSVSRSAPRQVTSPADMETARLLQRIRIQCEEARDLFGALADTEENAALHCHRLWGLAVAVWKEYEAAKQRRGSLDTEDLQEEGVRLLTKSPVVRARYQRLFRHLMVDEFQDTNPLQMRLINLLHVKGSQDTKTADVPRNHLFVVGDVQQSIYGFRHADSRLFRDMERKFREEKAGVHVSLAVNFRSRPEILQTVEMVFRQIWRDETTPFVPLTQGANFDAKPHPSLEVLTTQDLSRREYVGLEAEALAGRIQRMVEGEEFRITRQDDPRRGQAVAYRDIAVLLRGLTDVQKYEEAFARRGVPYFVVGGGRGYYARHEIRDLINVLTVLDTPLDDVALAATLRSPIVGVDTDTLYHLHRHARQQAEQTAEMQGNSSAKRYKAVPLYPALASLLETDTLPLTEREKLRDFIRIMDELRAQEDRLPVGHLLERLISHTRYDARLLCRSGGRRRLANVRKLLQMANADPVMGVRDFIRRLREMNTLSEREGDAPTEEEAADVVRILTIHGAKGLEFPVVILADMARGLLMPERGLFACDPQHFALGTKLNGTPNVVYKTIDRQRQEADKKEAARLLYVAMTRAREHLVLCGNIGRNRQFNWADEVFKLIGILDTPPEPDVQILPGGLKAHVCSLAYYRQLPNTLAPTPTRAAQLRQNVLRDQIADAIINNRPLDFIYESNL